jgi:carnosine N-methyltransferase
MLNSQTDTTNTHTHALSLSSPFAFYLAFSLPDIFISPLSFPGKRFHISLLGVHALIHTLTQEFSKRGYKCEANEFTYFMLLASGLLLHGDKVDEFTIHPYAIESKNVVRVEDQLRPVLVPDVNPADIPEGTPPVVMTQGVSQILPHFPAPLSSFVGALLGDFMMMYGADEKTRGVWDSVVTCFFLDTAKNILRY